MRFIHEKVWQILKKPKEYVMAESKKTVAIFESDCLLNINVINLRDF